MTTIVGMFRTVVFWLLGLGDPDRISEATEWGWYMASPLPLAVLVALGVMGVAVAAINLLPRNGLPWKARMTVIVMRLAAFAILIVILCQLEVRLTVRRALRPNVAVVTDTSGSMGVSDVGGKTRLAAARSFAKGLEDRLAGKAHVVRRSLNWQLGPDDPDANAAGVTYLMNSLAELARQERDLQAAILLGDGADTTGNTGATVAPIFAARGTPVYPVVFGQSAAIGLFRTSLPQAAEYVRLGDDLYLTVRLEAKDIGAQTVRVRVFLGGAEKPLLARENVRVGKDPVLVRFVVRPDKPGRYTYRIVVDGVQGPVPKELLEIEHTVMVVDQPIRVLLIDIPRDERKILGHWLARDPVVDLASLTLEPERGWFATGKMRHVNKSGLPDQEQDLYEYDVVILGDIPRGYFREGDVGETKLQWLASFVQRRGGGLVTLGGYASYGAGQYDKSALASILPFEIRRTEQDPQIGGKFITIPTAMGVAHPVMQLESDAKANREAWLELPKLEGCNRVGQVKPGAMLLAKRDLSDRKGEKGEVPLIAYQLVGKGQVLSLSADTTWRWEFQRPLGDEAAGEPEGTDYYRRFWGNAVRYLAPDPRLAPGRPQIARQKPDAAVGENYVLRTRLVDAYFRPITRADLTVRVTSPSGEKYRMFPCDSFSKPGVYEYAVTLTEPGTWIVQAIQDEPKVLAAVAKAKKQLAVAKGAEDQMAIRRATQALKFAESSIAVEKIRAGASLAEMEDPRARPALMEEFAARTGGQAFNSDQMDALLEKLDLVGHHVTRSYAIAVWNLPAVLVLFIVLVSLDCLIRKRRGLV